MATNVVRTGCELKVFITVQFDNQSGRSSEVVGRLVQSWQAGVNTIWNGPMGYRNWKCCRVVFQLEAELGSGDANYHQVVIVSGPGRSNASLGVGSGEGTWHVDDSPAVAAHEVGHLMGLDDEYDMNGPGGTYRNLNPQAPDQPESVMASVTDGRTAPLPAHIDHVMRNLHAQCSLWCCWRPGHWILFHGWDWLKKYFSSTP